MTKVYRLPGLDKDKYTEITPEPTDIIQFESGSIALVNSWDKDGFSLKSLQKDYIDRGWIFRLLEKWDWVDSEYKYRDIEITNKAYLIGCLQKEKALN